MIDEHEVMVPSGGRFLLARGSPTRRAVERSETERLYGRIPCPGSRCFRFRDPEALPQTKPLLCPTSPSSLRDATSPSRGGFGRPLGFISSPEAPLLGRAVERSETERLYRSIPCPRSRCFRFRDPEALPQTKQLLCPTSPSSLRDATSPSRGGFGRPPRSWQTFLHSRTRGLTKAPLGLLLRHFVPPPCSSPA